MKTRTYTKEFKQEAIQLALHAGNIKRTAEQLGIPEATLHTWVGKAKHETVSSAANDNNKKVTVSDLMEEVKSLRKALSLAEQEKAILKKATIFFAKEQT